MGYSSEQRAALRETILNSDAEVVVTGTPIDLGALLELERPVVRARYGFEEADRPGLEASIDEFLLGIDARRPC